MILNLRKKLEEWATLGFLSEPQAENILRHEEASSGKPWVLYGITGIGVTAIAVGVISLVAANWMELSAGLKLIGYFLLQASLGWGFIKLSERPGVWREALLTLFALLFFAGIGLVAQIYNLHSAPWKGLFFWLVLTLPLSQVGRSKMLAHVWVIASLVTCGMWASFHLSLSGVDGETIRWGCFAAYPLVLTAASFIFERWKISNQAFRSSILIWGVGVTLLVGTIFLNLHWVERHLQGNALLDFKTRLIPEIAIVIVAMASLLRGAAVPLAQRVTTALMFLVFGIFFFLPLEMRVASDAFEIGIGGSRVGPQIIGAVGFLSVWALAAASAAQAGHRRLFDLASLIIAVRFIVIYFEVFGSLSHTGFGLILSGVVVLAIAGLWAKYRTTFRNWMGGGA